MLNREAIQETLQAVAESPLYHLFGSSKELFHSNFLYWLSRINEAEFLSILCPEFPRVGKPTIEREKRVATGTEKATLDFHITNQNGDLLVVENKVKDYPDHPQLSRIRGAMQSAGKSWFVLLCLFPVESGLFPEWTVLDYGTLSSKILPERFANSQYHRLLIEDYKLFIMGLSRFASSLPVTEDYDFAIQHDKGLFDLLNSHKLWETYQRMRASHLVQAFHNLFGHESICTAYGVNNQKATMDFYIQLSDAVRIGIQIENDQYRKFISSPHAADDIAKLMEHNLFFKSDYRSPTDEPFLNYGATFKYQYDKMVGPVAFKLMLQAIRDDLVKGVLQHEKGIRRDVAAT